MKRSVVDPRYGVVQPRGEKEVKPRHKIGPDQTHKSFMTMDSPGVTEPEKVADDFVVRPVFPTQRPRSPASLADMTKEYFLFTHAPWLTWGGMTVDPLLEFHVRDGELGKCVTLVPLTGKLFFGVARRPEEAVAERSLFAVPRDRMRDLLWWMSGVVVTHDKKLLWKAAFQYLPLDRQAVGRLEEGDTRMLALFGCEYSKQQLLWYCRPDGYALAMANKPAAPTTAEKPKLIVPGDT